MQRLVSLACGRAVHRRELGLEHPLDERAAREPRRPRRWRRRDRSFVARGEACLGGPPHQSGGLQNGDRVGVERWRRSANVDAVERGEAAAQGWPEFINIPSKVGQVATMRVYARSRRDEADRRALVFDAVCPGMVDTPLSRPWFEDMSKAQTPDAAARDVIWLATAPRAEVPYGELVQHRKILPWREDGPPRHSS
jgi:hypothetical protein